MTKIFNKIGTGLLGILLLASCQDRDLPGSAEMQLITPDASSITGTLTGDNNYDYTLTWTPSNQNATMQVAVFKNGTQMQGRQMSSMSSSSSMLTPMHSLKV